MLFRSGGGDSDWYGYCLDDPVNMNDPLGLLGGTPESPEEGALYFANSWQWQASPGACDKCSALDGTYYDRDSPIPEKPHPNCKCNAVECYYGSDIGDWKEYKKSEPYYDHAIPVFSELAIAVRIWWTQTVWIKERRARTSYKICGERKDIIKTITEFRERKQVGTEYSTATCIAGGQNGQCEIGRAHV